MTSSTTKTETLVPLWKIIQSYDNVTRDDVDTWLYDEFNRILNTPIHKIKMYKKAAGLIHKHNAKSNIVSVANVSTEKIIYGRKFPFKLSKVKEILEEGSIETPEVCDDLFENCSLSLDLDENKTIQLCINIGNPDETE